MNKRRARNMILAPPGGRNMHILWECVSVCLCMDIHTCHSVWLCPAPFGRQCTLFSSLGYNNNNRHKGSTKLKVAPQDIMASNMRCLLKITNMLTRNWCNSENTSAYILSNQMRDRKGELSSVDFWRFWGYEKGYRKKSFELNGLLGFLGSQEMLQEWSIDLNWLLRVFWVTVDEKNKPGQKL